jgi:hypothetical protein
LPWSTWAMIAMFLICWILDISAFIPEPRPRKPVYGKADSAPSCYPATVCAGDPLEGGIYR